MGTGQVAGRPGEAEFASQAPIPTSTCKWEPRASQAHPVCLLHPCQQKARKMETAPHRDAAPSARSPMPPSVLLARLSLPPPGAPPGRPTGTLVDGGATAVLGEAAPPPQRVPIGQGAGLRLAVPISTGHQGPVRPATKGQEERQGPTPSSRENPQTAVAPSHRAG